MLFENYYLYLQLLNSISHFYFCFPNTVSVTDHWYHWYSSVDMVSDKLMSDWTMLHSWSQRDGQRHTGSFAVMGSGSSNFSSEERNQTRLNSISIYSQFEHWFTNQLRSPTTTPSGQRGCPTQRAKNGGGMTRGRRMRRSTATNGQQRTANNEPPTMNDRHGTACTAMATINSLVAL